MAAWLPGYDGLPPIQAFLNSAWLYAVIGAYPPTILLGVPAYFALRRQVEARLRNCMFVGAAIPLLSWGLFSLLPSSAESESVGGRATVVAGYRTVYGWELAGRDLIVLAVFGAAAGLVFGLIVVGWRRRLNAGKQSRNNPLEFVTSRCGRSVGSAVYDCKSTHCRH